MGGELDSWPAASALICCPLTSTLMAAPLERIAAAFTAPPLIRDAVLFQGVSLGGLNVAELSGSALALMAGWMRQYGDLPMDLADASLLWVAQEQGLRRIATLDRRDFGIVRLPGGESLENLLD